MNYIESFVKVSICIPAYNNIELLKRALNSILDQEFDDYEIVITDDSTLNEVGEFVLSINNKKIRYYKNLVKLGSPENWNYAVSLARGEYIKILHHDDWFSERSSLTKFVQLLEENPECTLGFCSSIACHADQTIAFVHSPTIEQLITLKNDPTCLYFGNFIGAPSATIFRRANFIYFDNSLKWLVDIDFYISLLSCESKIYAYNKDALIKIGIEGNHKVTNECAENKQVEIFEYIYLYKKINSNKFTIREFKFVSFLSNIFSKYQVNSINEIYQITNSHNIPSIIKIALMSNYMKSFYQKTKSKFKNYYLRFKKPKLQFSNVSYSQCGEDIIIDFILSWLGKKEITYLDIGTNDPVKFNNTFYFYKKGHKGVLVEPDLSLFKRIQKERPLDICINAGVGVGRDDQLTFYLMHPDTLSTSSNTKLEEYLALGIPLIGEYKVPLIEVNSIIERYFNSQPPTLLSIDVEGLDFEIIKSLDLKKYRPNVICAETLTYTNNNEESKTEEISKYLLENNYFIYADTYINTIFVDLLVWNSRP